MLPNQSSPNPLRIERRESEGLIVTWSDTTPPTLVSSEHLRRSCPCALCREERGEGNHDAPLSPKEAKPKSKLLAVINHTKSEQLKIEKVWPVGNYAIGIRWGDGHDDGIYPFKLLHELSEKASTADETKQ